MLHQRQQAKWCEGDRVMIWDQRTKTEKPATVTQRISLNIYMIKRDDGETATCFGDNLTKEVK
jgi:hypothetical protein